MHSQAVLLLLNKQFHLCTGPVSSWNLQWPWGLSSNYGPRWGSFKPKFPKNALGQCSAKRLVICDELKTIERLRYSQQTTTGNNPKPNKSTPHHISLKTISIKPSHLYIGPLNDLFLSGFLIKTLHAASSSSSSIWSSQCLLNETN